MAQRKNLSDSNDELKKITESLDELSEHISECEAFENALGTDDDSPEFRYQMTMKIRSTTELCRFIKSDFNKNVDANNTILEPLQQRFVKLHGQLKECVSKIKTKSKEYVPHNKKRKAPKLNSDMSQQSNGLLDDDDILCSMESKLFETEYKIDDPNVCNHIVKEGYLAKRSKYLKSWRKRWVVLEKHKDGISLLTFKEKNNYKNPTENIHIDDNIEIAPKKNSENEFSLRSKENKLKFRFKALDREQRKEWIDIFHFVSNIRHIKNRENIPHNHHIDFKEESLETAENIIKMYDRSSCDVQDCLLMIQDLAHLRDENSKSNEIITDFEMSLNEKGVVSKEQIDQLRDVSIQLIGSLFDQEEM